MPAAPPIVVVEDDPFLRLIQVILDPATPPERSEAFSHFMAHDEPNFAGWCEGLRARLGKLYPAEVRLACDENELRARLDGARVLVVEAIRVAADTIAAAGGALSVVQKYGTITSGIDEAACRVAGVRLLTIRRRANIATAEHAFALLLALARQLNRTSNRISDEQLVAAGFAPTRFARDQTPNGNWARIKGLRTLYGQQLGIVGMGEIGREMALRAGAFGMRLVYSQRHRLPEAVERRYGATYSALPDLLAHSDCVSLHLPPGPGTRNFIGRGEFASMKVGALLINVSQPALVDREALRDALSSGRLGGYGMDIFYEEPGDPEDPLLRFPNVIVTPHLGGSPRANALEDFAELLPGIAQALD